MTDFGRVASEWAEPAEKPPEEMRPPNSFRVAAYPTALPAFAEDDSADALKEALQKIQAKSPEHP